MVFCLCVGRTRTATATIFYVVGMTKEKKRYNLRVFWGTLGTFGFFVTFLTNFLSLTRLGTFYIGDPLKLCLSGCVLMDIGARYHKIRKICDRRVKSHHQ